MDQQWLKLYHVLKGLGLDLNFYSKADGDRQLLQRLVYLLEVFGYPIHFTYEPYQNGPYAQHANMEAMKMEDYLKAHAVDENIVLSNDEKKAVSRVERAIDRNRVCPGFLDGLVLVDFLLKENGDFDIDTLWEIINYSTIYELDKAVILEGKAFLNDFRNDLGKERTDD